jgi:hypothetical protein
MPDRRRPAARINYTAHADTLDTSDTTTTTITVDSGMAVLP